MEKIAFPIWFPYPISWVKALILSLLISITIFILNPAPKLFLDLAILSEIPELSIIIWSIVLFLLPIVIIAVIHHCFHLFLKQYLPSIQAPEMSKVKGAFPGIMSWWEGVYGWMVTVLSSLIALVILLFLFNTKSIFSGSGWSETDVKAIWNFLYFLIAAYLYHLEYLAKQQLMDVYILNQNQRKNENKTAAKSVDVEVDRLRGDMGLNQMKKKKKSTNPDE